MRDYIKKKLLNVIISYCFGRCCIDMYVNYMFSLKFMVALYCAIQVDQQMKPRFGSTASNILKANMMLIAFHFFFQGLTHIS